MKRFFTLVLLIFIMMVLGNKTAYADRVHRVAAGESLSLIARKYGVPVSDIIDKNNLFNPNALFVNQVLIIPEVKESSTYLVKPGDTLFKISQKFDVAAEVIARANGLESPNFIYPGQALHVPSPGADYKPAQPATEGIYWVQPGDTLYKISQKLGVPVEDLARWNGIVDWSYLYVGQILSVPDQDSKAASGAEPSPSASYKIPWLLHKFGETLFVSGPQNGRKVALTFDDGPDDLYTIRILEVLKQYGVPATFFLVGKRVVKHPQVVERIFREGHGIGNHSWSHAELTEVSAERLRMEVVQTEEAIRQITGERTTFFRPPYGAVSEELLGQLQQMGYKVINWSVDSVDWRAKDVDQILINTLPDVKEGAIILFHSAGGEGQNLDATVNALPELIYTLKVMGYTFVTLNDLLQKE